MAKRLACALGVLSGCAPGRCESPRPWSEIEVVAADPAHEDFRAYVEGAVAQFGSWASGDAVCIERVEVGALADTRGHEVGGSYSFADDLVSVAVDTVTAYESTFHELCHAVDATEGLRLGRKGPFDPGTVAEREVYRTRTARVAEAFARECELGPAEVDRFERWRDECGVGVPDVAAVRYVADEVFADAPHIPWDAPTFDVEVGAAWQADDVEADTHTQFTRFDDWEVEAVEASGDSLVVLFAHVDGYAWGASFVDPRTGKAFVWWQDDVCEDGIDCAAALVPAPEGAWMRIVGEGTSWWRPEGHAFVPVETSCPGNADFVADGAFWWAEDGAYRRCDVASGVITAADPVEAPALDPWSRWGAAAAVPTEGGAGWFTSEVGLVVPSGSGSRSVALPPYLAVRQAVVRGDEAFLTVSGHAMTETVFTTAVVRADLRDGSLHAPTAACVPGVPFEHALLVAGDTLVLGWTDEEGRRWFQPVAMTEG